MDFEALLADAPRNAAAMLRASDRRTLKSLFCSLKPPDIDAFTGEFDAELLDQGGRIGTLATRRIFGLNGNWLGKAFRPVGNNRGEGYNYFQVGESIIGKLPMQTTIADSRIAPGKSLIIDYRQTNRGLIRWLIGELREVHPHVILGIGTFGPKWGRRDQWRRKIPFMMLGPVRPFQVRSATPAMPHRIPA